MQSRQDQYVHQLSVQTILNIIANDAWKTGKQSITSAVTNDNDLKDPDMHWVTMGENTAGTNAFSDIKFDKHVKRILDVGGGKFDANSHYMKRDRNIDLMVWDPYNRSQSHNEQVQKNVMASKVDAITSMSVLNVIPEVEVRLAHIATLKAALVVGGKAYIKIWSGEKPLQGTYLPSATSDSYQANAYADRFLTEIEVVFGIGNVVLDKSVPNLIIAVKRSEAAVHVGDIVRIQHQSKNEGLLFEKLKQNSVSKFYSRSNILKLFFNKSYELQAMDDKYIEKNRHANSQLQAEYDRRFGLVPYGFKHAMK